VNSRCRWGLVILGMVVVGGWVGIPLSVRAQDQEADQQDPVPQMAEDQQSSEATEETVEAPQQEAAAQSEPASAEAPATSAIAAPPPGGQPEGSALITVDFKDAEIRQVLRILSLKSGVDIVASPDVEGLVTIKLTNVPWEQALDIILRTYGFTYERKANVVRVLTLEAVEQEALATEVFPLSYAKAKEVEGIVKDMLSDRGKVKFDERTNTIIVTDLPSNLFQLKEVIFRLDQATPQIHIESRFVETRLTRDENLGIDWFDSIAITTTGAQAPTTFPFPGGASFGNIGEEFVPKPGDLSPSTGAAISQGKIPQVGGTFTFGTINPGTFNFTLNMLKSRTDTKVISRPTIVTLNNKEAFVQVGTDVNIPNFQVDSSTGRVTVSGFSTRSTGILLKVTPRVNPRDEIVMDVTPEITTVGADRTFASGITFPDFDVQKAQTQVRLLNGETLAIGGLKRNAERVALTKVPLLGDIPIIGALFTNRREQTPSGQDQLDLLIFMTVHLVKPPAQEAQTTVAAQPAGE